jgi:hypothetical protein
VLRIDALLPTAQTSGCAFLFKFFKDVLHGRIFGWSRTLCF